MSENPYKEGQALVRKTHLVAKYKVLGVCGGVVFISEYDNYESHSHTLHWKEVQEHYTLEPEKKWEPLTDENWLERRDQGVWGPLGQLLKLIGFEPKADFPFKVTDAGGVTNEYTKVSIYNDDGIEAVWND